jgi:prespore-specific regulator
MKNRSDAWNPAEDELLASTVLECIKTGSTQLKAFQIAGEKLNRTPSACRFRWNAEVRKRYTNEIVEAKNLKKQLKNKLPKNKKSKPEKSLSTIIESDLIEEISRLRSELTEKDNIIKELQKEISALRNPEQQLSEDYKMLLKIFENARKLGLLQPDKKIYKVDADGNIEKIS